MSIKINNNIDYKATTKTYTKNSEEKSFDMFFKIKIWRVKDVARYLGCTVGHIYNLVSEKRIPTRKKGKFLFFLPDEIYHWVLEGEVQ